MDYPAALVTLEAFFIICYHFSAPAAGGIALFHVTLASSRDLFGRYSPYCRAFAFLGPTSAPGASGVLQAGFEGRTAEDEVVHDAVEPSTAPSTDSH